MSRQDLYPWLSALYVKENKRGKGVGQELQNFLVEYCRIKGFKELFLLDLAITMKKLGGNTLKMVLNFQGII